MKRQWQVTTALAMLLALAAQATAGDESPAAKGTRKRIQQKITLDWKDIPLKSILDDVKNEMDKPVSFKIDNVSGLSNNTKYTFSVKDKTVAEFLSGLSDKGEFGWFVKNDPKDRYDGWIIIRKIEKGKERGYEAGMEPGKESSSLRWQLPWNLASQGEIRAMFAIDGRPRAPR